VLQFLRKAAVSARRARDGEAATKPQRIAVVGFVEATLFLGRQIFEV
jgi:hypothetical protein